MQVNFVLGKVIGNPANMENIEAKIKEYLSDEKVFTVPTDGIVKVSLFSGDPPFFTIMGTVSDSANRSLLHFSFPDGENIVVKE